MSVWRSILVACLISTVLGATEARADGVRGTGDLGIVVERASGRIQIVETTGRTRVGSVGGLGDLSHATAVFSRDGRYAFVFGRDGGVSKVDLLEQKIAARTIQAGNSIGGAISQDGTLIAVANYEPGGVRVLDSRTLAPVAEIPAIYGDGRRSKVVGLADLSGQRFVFTLYDADEIWIADFADIANPKITKFPGVGHLPYDALVTGDGRYYVAGLFGEDGLAMIDLWKPAAGVKRILAGYGNNDPKLPIFKMPHLRGWAQAGGRLFLPAIGRHEVLVVEIGSWKEISRVPVHGQPVFVMARPDGRQVWVNFAHPRNDTVQVIDALSLEVTRDLRPGKAVMHMEFTPRGEQIWVSVRDENRVDVFDTRSFEKVASMPAEKPSGILFTARANRIGM